MSAHRYWRLYITEGNDTGGTVFIRIYEAEMRSFPGGPDLCSGGTVIYSDYNTSNATNAVPSKAFDNNASSYWQSGGTPGAIHWIGYDFGEPVDVAEMSIISGGGETPKAFEIQYSDDGAVWSTVAAYWNQTEWISGVPRLFNAYIANITGNIIESLPITDWHVVASRCADGVLMGSAFVSGATYDIDIITLEPCNITLSPRIDYAWSAAKVAAVGDYMVPSNPDAVSHLFRCDSVTGDAKTGEDQPAFNLSGTTADNNVTWAYVALLVDPITLGPKIPVPY
jgi:hypothetical protein